MKEWEVAEAFYKVSDNKKIDDLMDNIAKTTFETCRGDLFNYVEKQTATIGELEAMNLQPEQWRKAFLRHGLPQHLRSIASHHHPQSENAPFPAILRFEVDRDLAFAHERFQAQPPLPDPEPSTTAKRQRRSQSSNAEGDDDTVPEPDTKKQKGESRPESTKAQMRSATAKRRKNANDEGAITRVNVKN